MAKRLITWFDDSPDVGLPECKCSYCDQIIAEDDGVPIRLFHETLNQEARFHPACWSELFAEFRRIGQADHRLPFD